jgi:hypothetical protein
MFEGSYGLFLEKKNKDLKKHKEEDLEFDESKVFSRIFDTSKILE